MWRLKSCPRCSGDMSLDVRQEYPVWECLQCGYNVAIKPLSKKPVRVKYG